MEEPFPFLLETRTSTRWNAHKLRRHQRS
jgi:hypothetical protein